MQPEVEALSTTPVVPIAEAPSPFSVSDAEYFRAAAVWKGHIDPFLKAERICCVCRQVLPADNQLPPLRARWNGQEIVQHYCDDCAQSGPLGPVSESYDALCAVDKDRREREREWLLTACRQQRQVALAPLREKRAQAIHQQLEAAWNVLDADERRLVDLEIFLQNVPAMGRLATDRARRLSSESRLQKEREAGATVTDIRRRLSREGHSRVDAALVAWEAFNQFMPQTSYPGSDAMARATTSGDADGTLSMLANRVEGKLPARSACNPLADDSESDSEDHFDICRERMVAPGYVENEAAKGKADKRQIVAAFMLSPKRAEFDSEEQNLVLTWLGGAGQAELAELSGKSQPTISRLLSRVLQTATAFCGSEL
jgi:hypothetical protein